jgi:hypothetical protein
MMALDVETDLIAGISKRPVDCPVKYQISRRASELEQSLFLFLMEILLAEQ